MEASEDEVDLSTIYRGLSTIKRWGRDFSETKLLNGC